ncbi:glycosyltransferase family 87 protein [Kitasatospora kifunensis]|uniref:DUF2029 domain-containing protein n=1 Tax=Kitasatospora kifunensis TaxID=58351 RepID=A0A7W7R4I8_KITKI|nr:glycosyltransferase family 87 protein [Kitasatospora kifunensis]MBB4925277.1 hypothetical protein [Kitasatospora kifunensis]
MTETQPRSAAGASTGSSSSGGRPALVWWRPDTWPMRVLAPLGYWASTRLIMIMMVFQTHEDSTGEVNRLYQSWAHILQGGSYPIGDTTWQYPPGAAGVMLAPLAIPGVNYVLGFIVVTLLADLVVMAALLRYGTRPERSLAGAWVWLLMLPLMLFIPYARYDVIVTFFAVLALLWLQGRPWLGGGMAALGAMIKVWPAFAVFGAPRGRSLWQVVVGFVAAAGSLVAIAALLFKGSFGFLDEQGNRGVEYESLPGSALLVAHHFGYQGRIEYRFGSLEVVGPYVDEIGKAMLVASVVGFCWLLLWRLRARTFSAATPADAALAVVLVFITTSRVISPQYLIWVAGIGAVCLSFKSTTQRPIVGILVLATAMTSVEFPLFFQSLINGSAGFQALLLARNVLLLVATVWSCVRLWRSTVPGRRHRHAAA